MPSVSSSRRLALGSAIAMLVASVAACGAPGPTPASTATHIPSPAPRPTPTPTPTPMSALDSFRAKVTSPDFQAQGSVTGTVNVSLIVGSSSGPVTGTFKVKGGDSDDSISSKILGNTITYDSIVVGGTAYSRSNGGGWSQSTASGRTLQDIVRGIVLTDEGLQGKFGRLLHHLTVADVAGIDVAAFGISAGPDQSNLTLESLSFWAGPDGTPAGLSLRASLDQKVSITTAHETVTLDISIDTLAGVTIAAPTT